MPNLSLLFPIGVACLLWVLLISVSPALAALLLLVVLAAYLGGLVFRWGLAAFTRIKLLPKRLFVLDLHDPVGCRSLWVTKRAWFHANFKSMEAWTWKEVGGLALSLIPSCFIAALIAMAYMPKFGAPAAAFALAVVGVRAWAGYWEVGATKTYHCLHRDEDHLLLSRLVKEGLKPDLHGRYETKDWFARLAFRAP